MTSLTLARKRTSTLFFSGVRSHDSRRGTILPTDSILIPEDVRSRDSWLYTFLEKKEKKKKALKSFFSQYNIESKQKNKKQNFHKLTLVAPYWSDEASFGLTVK